MVPELNHVPFARDLRIAGDDVEIRRVRLENLRKLIEQFADGNAAKYCEQYGLSYKTIQQILAPKGVRNLGTRLARGIEARHKLEAGWMDTDRSRDSQGALVPGGRSDRAQRLAHLIEQLPPSSSELVEQLVQKLAATKKKRRK